MSRRATVRVPGTCGEMVQGTCQGIPFHVSCPVDLYSTVQVEFLDRPGQLDGPPDSPKAAAALRACLEFHSLDHPAGRLRIQSSLPRSKGMASSTADVAGAIYAATWALGRQIAPIQAARLALSVEPTDGSLFPHIVLFDHRGGRLWKELGPCPPLEVVILDFGGEVDTVAFNQVDRSALLWETEPQVAEALAWVRDGLAGGGPALVGKGATLSALANQRILYKPQLEAVLEAAEVLGALGVNVAHSGTVLGVLLDPRRHDSQDACRYLKAHFPDLQLCLPRRLVGGGQVRVG